jgi:hypothetical protein
VSAQTRTGWRISGEEIGACNCDWGCPCQFNALPTHDNCEGLVAWQIGSGYFGGTDLADLKFAAVYWWPGPIHEGNGVRQTIVDVAATPDQHDAIVSLASGAHGHPYWEIFAAVCPNVLATVTAPIALETDRERRIGSIRVEGVGETTVEPIRNPVTDEEHRVRIVIPDGFEYEEAEVANAMRLRVETGSVRFEHENVYAQLNQFDWANE